MSPDHGRIPAAILQAEGISWSDILPTEPVPVDVEEPAPPAPAPTPTSVGEASWYGDYFHGRLTASGETFDMYAMTAAHRTLPLGTVVEVRRADTGASVEVVINDRGPFQPGSGGAVDHPTRVIDLSFGAARELGAIDAGVVDVEVFIRKP